MYLFEVSRANPRNCVGKKSCAKAKVHLASGTCLDLICNGNYACKDMEITFNGGGCKCSGSNCPADICPAQSECSIANPSTICAAGNADTACCATGGTPDCPLLMFLTKVVSFAHLSRSPNCLGVLFDASMSPTVTPVPTARHLHGV